MRILITGGCGFVGSSVAKKIKLKYPHYDVVCLDNLKRRGSEINLHELLTYEVNFIHGDIRNEEDLDQVGAVDFVIDCSAEPSVLAGLSSGQKQLLNINLVGSLNILNYVKEHNASMIFLSTSRVYPVVPLNEIKFTESDTRFEFAQDQQISGVSEKGISEDFTLNGYKSIYGASKLATEIVMHEFEHFYGLNLIINRCGVIAGPGQMGKIDQGVLVLWVARHYWKKDLAYIGYGGSGKQVRDVLHIEDLFDLIDLQLHHPAKFSGHIFNVGGGYKNSVSLSELTAICERVVGNNINFSKITEDRQADIKWYITDNSRISQHCDWTPSCSVEKNVIDVFEWINKHEKSLKSVLK